MDGNYCVERIVLDIKLTCIQRIYFGAEAVFILPGTQKFRDGLTHFVTCEDKRDPSDVMSVFCFLLFKVNLTSY